MIAKKTRIRENASLSAFGIIVTGFPLTYLSRFLPGAELLSTLGLSALSVAAILVVLTSVLIAGTTKIDFVEVMVVFWVFFSLTSTIIFIALGKPNHTFLPLLTSSVQTIAFLLIFRGLNLNSNGLLYLSIAAILLLHASMVLIGQSVSTEISFIVSYQTAAIVIAVSGLIIAFKVKGMVGLLLVVYSGYLLFLNGARTEFFLFIPAAYFVFARPSLLRTSVIFALSILTLYVFGLDIERALLSAEDASRIFRILGRSEDNSFLQRQMANANAIAQIVENPVWGDHGNYSPGAYSHNALSAWIDFGLLGFSLYISILAILFIRSVQLFLKGSSAGRLVFGLAFLLLLAAVISKSYLYPLLGLVAGILSRVRATEGRRK